jgi:hypothetical protein
VAYVDASALVKFPLELDAMLFVKEGGYFRV